MLNLLEQAQEAAHQEDWQLLNGCLQQLLAASEPAVQEHEGVCLEMAMKVLAAGDFQDRWDVAKLFPALGEGAIAPLVELLENTDAHPEARWFTARILSTFNHPAAIQALIRVLRQSDDEDLSAMAAAALANLGEPAIVGLGNLLADPQNRLLAVEALAQIRQSATITPLLRVVDDPDPTVRSLAIAALGSFHDPRIPSVLLQALNDPVAAVRIAAIQGLAVRSELVGELGLVECLSHCLGDVNLQVCQQAAIGLGRLGTDTAAAALFHLLQAPHTPLPLQLEAVRALGWIGSAIALNYLQQALHLQMQPESESQLVPEIIVVLGRWQASELKPQAAQILIEALNANQPVIAATAVKQSIALSLGHLAQPQAFEALTQLLPEKDIGVRLHTIAALKALDRSTSRQRLERLAQRVDIPEELRQGVAIALQEWDGNTDQERGEG